MPEFSKLEPGTIKRAAPFRERVYGGDNEYIPVVSALPPIESVMHRLNGRPATFEEVTAAPLTFDVRFVRHWETVGLNQAVKLKRQGWRVDEPNRALLGSDFADYGDRILLAELGYFSADLPKHRAKRDHEAQREAYLDQAYDVLHLDRKAVHAMIAAKLEATRFDGIWARSTGEYSHACAEMDDLVLAHSPAIAQSISELAQ